jgi:hypothetical protein
MVQREQPGARGTVFGKYFKLQQGVPSATSWRRQSCKRILPASGGGDLDCTTLAPTRGDPDLSTAPASSPFMPMTALVAQQGIPMKKMIAVLVVSAFAGGNALVASAASASAEKPAPAAAEVTSPHHASKHATKAAAPHHKMAKSKKAAKVPHAS